jgi:hypothetical protein
MLTFGDAVQPTNMAKTNYFLTPIFLSIYLFCMLLFF